MSHLDDLVSFFDQLLQSATENFPENSALTDVDTFPARTKLYQEIEINES